MSLRDEGFRFMVSLDRKRANWFQLPDSRCEGWADCTELDDDEFAAFMAQQQE